jgi:hypothetical protein
VVEQSLAAFISAACADLEAGEVDDGFQPSDCAHAGQGAGVEVGGGVLVAHLACEVGKVEIIVSRARSVEGDACARELGAGDKFGPHAEEIVERAGPAEVAAHAVQPQGLGPSRGPR